MLCASQILVAEHFTYGLDGNAIHESNGSRERVPSYVKGQALLDAAEVCNLLQVGIRLLVADHR